MHAQQSLSTTSPSVAERDCAGHASIVRDLKKRLDAAIEEAGCSDDTNLARDTAFSLALELESYGVTCRKCLGMAS